METIRYCFATGLIGCSALLLPLSVTAGQDSTHFQVSLRIVARPPAPKVSQQVVSNASPGEPPHLPTLKDRVKTAVKAGAGLVVITTEF